MASSLIIRSCSGAAVLLSCAFPVYGQGNETALAAKHRNECRLAAQILHSGEPHTKREWAIVHAGSCADVGPEALGAQWRRITNDREDFDTLVRASRRLRDARLYQQLRVTAADRSRPATVRAGAMLVLAKYVDPGNAIWLTDLIPPDSVRRIPLIRSWTTNQAQLAGSEPLSQSVAAPVLALLESIAAARSEEPMAVWYAAAVLARRVRSDIDIGTVH